MGKESPNSISLSVICASRRRSHSELRRLALRKSEHALNDLLRARDVPPGKGLLAATTNGRAEHTLRTERQFDRRQLLARLLARAVARLGTQRSLHCHLPLRSARAGRVRHDERGVRRRLGRGEGDERAEHVLVRLVVASTEHELRLRVLVQDALHDLALVDCERPHLEVLLPDEHLDGTFVREVVLQQILALTALEEAVRVR